MPFRHEIDVMVKACTTGLWIVTAEPAEVERELLALANEPGSEWSFLYSWDAYRGPTCLKEKEGYLFTPAADATGASPKSAIALLAALGNQPPSQQDGCQVLTLHNFHKFLHLPDVLQGLINQLQAGKQTRTFAVVLTTSMQIPPELKTYFTVLHHELPSRSEIEQIVRELFPDETKDRVIPGQLLDAAAGLTRYEAENAFSVSVAREGRLSTRPVWEHKAQMLAKDGTLTIYKGTEGFESLGGLQAIKQFCLRALAPRANRKSVAKGVIALGVPGAGKCFGRNTPVLMFDGTVKPVQDVRTGDLLMGPDSKPRCVLGTTSGYGPLYRVMPVKGDPYVVNEDHVLSLKESGQQKGRHHQLCNITVRDYLKKGRGWQSRMKGWRTGVEWEAKPVSIDPYILGIWLGDGHSDDTAVTTADVEVVEALWCEASLRELKFTLREERGIAREYAITTTKGLKNSLRQDLRAYGLLHNKHIPQVYLINSRENRLQLLAGLIDSDGYRGNNYYEVSQKRRHIAEQIVFLARSLGFAAYMKVTPKTCTNNGMSNIYYRVSISGHINEIPVRVQRKRAKERGQNKDVQVTGINVKYVSKGTYYGFEVDQDHLFLLGDFTVTHNSALAKALGHETDRPTAILDIASLLSKYVGESEGRLKQALNTLEAVSPCVCMIDEIEKGLSGVGSGLDSGVMDRIFGMLLSWRQDTKADVFLIATSNNVAKMPAPLLRAGRTNAIFFFDLPTRAEKDLIWAMYRKYYGLEEETTIPDDTDWTGAEIKNACELADLLGVSLETAASMVVPISTTSSNQIDELRQWAEGRVLSATTPGIYKRSKVGVKEKPQRRRNLKPGNENLN